MGTPQQSASKKSTKPLAPPAAPPEGDAPTDTKPDEFEKQLEAAAAQPADFVCQHQGMVGPNGDRYDHGQPVPEFRLWPERARAVLLRNGWVVPARNAVQGETLIGTVVPQPSVDTLRADAAKRRAENAAIALQAIEKSDKPVHAAAPRYVSGMPDPDPHFSKFDDVWPDEGIKMEKAGTPILPQQPDPGSIIHLDDGTEYQVPFDEATPGHSKPADDGIPMPCTLCVDGPDYRTVVELKQHLARVHGQ